MLESADLKQYISKEDFKREKNELEERLVTLQQRAIRDKLPVVICVDGWSGSGKGTVISKLVAELDPRAFNVCPMNTPTDDERRYPLMTRYWQRIGRYGTMTIFDKSWYHEVFQQVWQHLKNKPKKRRKLLGRHPVARTIDTIYGGESATELSSYAASAYSLEKQLVDDGYLVIKCFLHVSKEEQARRIADLSADIETAWRVSDRDLEQNRDYEKILPLLEKMLELTDYERCPWHVIAAEDKRVCRLQLMGVIADEMEAALERKALGVKSIEQPDTSKLTSRFNLVKAPTVETMRHDLTIEDDEYRTQLKALQKKLSQQQLALYQRGVPIMLAYEGWDAAGKGGNIKRVAQAFDARDYRVVPSASPTPLEKEHPFLWRYWMSLPKSGHAAIYDRTWYGRVLVERVEGFATGVEWSRAFDEINEFEWEMHQAGAVLLKFWVDVSPEEQLARFEARQNDPAKRWKITDEDWRNRDKYPDYKVAIDDMLRLTSTDFAPWHVLESDNKHYARIKALKIITEALDEKLKD